MQVVTAAGVVGAIAIDATAGWLHGFWPAAVIVIAIVLGEVLADQRATREHVRRRGVRRKNLRYAADWLADDFVEHQVFPGTTPDKKVAIGSYRIFFAASPDMTTEIHDMVAAGDRVAIGATYRGTDQGGFIPGIPATGKAFEMEAMYIVRVNDQVRSPPALGSR
jgi:predicted ester cyclase